MTALALRAPSSHARRPAAPVLLDRFRPDIEGFRAVIISMVVLHHIGFMVFGGVDISFALSGFLGVSIILRELERTAQKFGRPTLNLAKFYASRARRLLPMAGIVTIATVLASFLLLPTITCRGSTPSG